ncbi:MAG TPA: DNA-3-methyladenine glycosylase 2 family protein [Burkholderiales bacterium]|jgi:DNA-3-methyladenine glycosylase II|nr:DNA-3-methyladenine glycosylase 2 family protein [Burkholderiales bacterium]
MKPEYWDRAKRALARRDPVIAGIIRTHPKVFLSRRGEAFMTLARAIVGQQISVKAAQSVWDRFAACVGEVTPEKVLSKDRPVLRACGLSDRKTEYIADLAQHFADGAIRVQRWPQMSDEEIIAELVEVRGIGRWTAEMFLIFNLLRPDVFPLDDLGLQKAIRISYYKKRKVSLNAMRRLGESWRPWRSVATWYLWRSLDPLPVEY